MLKRRLPARCPLRSGDPAWQSEFRCPALGEAALEVLQALLRRAASLPTEAASTRFCRHVVVPVAANLLSSLSRLGQRAENYKVSLSLPPCHFVIVTLQYVSQFTRRTPATTTSVLSREYLSVHHQITFGFEWIRHLSHVIC